MHVWMHQSNLWCISKESACLCKKYISAVKCRLCVNKITTWQTVFVLLGCEILTSSSAQNPCLAVLSFVFLSNSCTSYSEVFLLCLLKQPCWKKVGLLLHTCVKPDEKEHYNKSNSTKSEHYNDILTSIPANRSFL